MSHKASLISMTLILTVGFLSPAPAGEAGPAAPGAALRPVDAAVLPDLFVWTDTCNVYVLRDGDAALLIDLGDGSVLEQLPAIGVKQVEWALFTHHHREQCQGHPRLQGRNVKIAVPQRERELFEKPVSFRKMKPSLGDAYTVHGASYVRPPIQPLRVDRAFAAGDEFTWRGYTLRCVQTRGNSPGAMSYLLRRGERWLAFSGDVMVDGARMHNWFDTEWDYGFAAGIYPLCESAAMLASFEPALLLPSHGPVIREAAAPLRVYERKLRALEKLYLRGYEVNRFANADQDRVSRPTSIPAVWQVSPHLFKLKGPDGWWNFGILIADSGRGLVVDSGLLDAGFVDNLLAQMRERLGLKGIDAVIITHMHGDHILGAPHLREKHGAQVWTLDSIADKFEHPERYDYAAMVQAYGAGFDAVKIDRTFKPGERLDWEGFRLTVDWMPGQTEFGLCLQGEIDGKKVAFTGDNIFGDPADPAQNGHEAMVARNSAVLEEGYIYAAEYLQRLRPDLLIGGHSFVMDSPAAMIDRYHRWSLDMREAFRSLSPDDDYRYCFDPYWVKAEPYRVSVRRGGTADLHVVVRNFRGRDHAHSVAIHTPPGLTAEPAVLSGRVGPEQRTRYPVRVQAAADAPPGTCISAFDITLDGRRYGEWFDFIVQVE